MKTLLVVTAVLGSAVIAITLGYVLYKLTLALNCKKKKKRRIVNW